MESAITTPPSTAAQWNEACTRLESYLLSHGISDRERLLRLTLEMLDAARKIHATDPAQTPVATTLHFAEERVSEWFDKLATSHAAAAKIANLPGMQGRAAWFAVKAHRRWSSNFLSSDPDPELLNAVRRESIQAGPGLEFSSLQRQEVDYGTVEDVARETWQKFSWSRVLRAFFLWTAIFFAAWAVQIRYFP